MLKEYPPVIGVPEAAEILGICTKEVYNLVHRADFFPAFRIGSRIKISHARLLEWIDVQTRGGVRA